MKPIKAKAWPASLAIGAALGAIALAATRTEVTAMPEIADISALIPAPPLGWTARDTPLGKTELESGETVKTLNASALLYRTYQCGNLEVALYVAYWNAGRMDPAQVIAHRPEVCWVSNGAVLLQQSDAATLPVFSSQRTVPGLFGRYQFASTPIDVIFWHRTSTEVSKFSASNTSFWSDRINKLWWTINYSLEPKSQLVYRLSTNETFAAVTSSGLWPALCLSLQRAGLLAAGNGQ